MSEPSGPRQADAQTEGEDRPARLAVGVVGTGRVGAVLGAALARAGHRVVAAYAVSVEPAARPRIAPGVALVTPPEVFAASDLVILAVPDDALPGLVEGLVATRSIRAGQIVVHTSGRHGADVLEPATSLVHCPWRCTP